MIRCSASAKQRRPISRRSAFFVYVFVHAFAHTHDYAYAYAGLSHPDFGDAIRRFIQLVVHGVADGISPQLKRLERLQMPAQERKLADRRIEPVLQPFLVQHDRHPLLQQGQRAGSRYGHDRRRAHQRPLWRPPLVIQAGHGEQRLPLDHDPHGARLLRSVLLRSPLPAVHPAARNDAAAADQHLLEAWLGFQQRDIGIDGILGPERKQPPSGIVHDSHAVAVVADDRDVLRRSDIVAHRRNPDGIADREPAFKLLDVRRKRKTHAHSCWPPSRLFVSLPVSATGGKLCACREGWR
ncbi:hypothetical protein BN871_AV_00270 [Paenibacillus sp. P22]|nr:hypothetical protein BN871_AV_00270 [Paenibacillus sp. P22]